MPKRILITPIRASLLMLAFFLVACSGGSLESDSDNVTPAVLVGIGNDKSVNEGATVTLTGDASGETQELTYAWSVAPDITITHPDTSSPEATFVAPETTEPLTYTFTLVVTDGNGNQGSDSAVYTVQPVNEIPVAVISVAEPDNIDNLVFPAGVDVVLDAKASRDVDAIDDQPIVSWRWRQTAGTDVLQSVSLDGDNIAFTTPINEADNTLTFELTVTDAEGAQGTTSLTLTVLSESNTIPTVDAGIAHTVFSGEDILLNGEANTTIPNGRPLSFNWLNDSELEPTINNASAMQTFAIAPKVSSEQTVTFTLEVTDTFNNKVSDSVTVRVKPLPLSPLNDTGVTIQADATTNSTTYQPGFPGQDGQRGKDIIDENGMSAKAGSGDAGFDFTRLDSLGDEVDDLTKPWSCVRDNITGLVWEVKTTGTGLHSRNHTYSWYQTSDDGGFNGDRNATGTSCSIANCDTSGYTSAVNGAGLCNFNDWRIPTHRELMSIVHFGKTGTPMIDTTMFPNSAPSGVSPLWYWTRISSVDGSGGGNALNAWAIDFTTGNDNFLYKGTPAYIRLVRGGR